MSASLMFAPGLLALRQRGAVLLAGAPGGPPPDPPDQEVDVVNILGIGQSNAGYFSTVDQALTRLAEGAGFYLGAVVTGALARWADNSPYTIKSGYGLYNTLQPGSYFLTYNSAASPSAWTLGTAGNAVSAYLSGLTTEQRDGIVAVWQYWNETDSLMGYGQKATYKAACIRWMALLRAMLGRTAAQLPVLWSGPPYGVPGGANMTLEVRAELAADAAQNVVLALPQTGDCIWRDATYNAATGTYSGGSDTGHVAATDNIGFGKRAALVAARAIAAAQGLSAEVIPSALGAGTGPRITAALLSGNAVTLTVQHDAGTDLVVPLLAASGAGFAVMDGGSIAAPGTIIDATACVRLDATHLRVTLATTPSNAASACRLFYPYGNRRMGRGNAVTDNAAALARPSGFDIGATLGSSWVTNMPLQTPVNIASGVATAGIALT